MANFTHSSSHWNGNRATRSLDIERGQVQHCARAWVIPTAPCEPGVLRLHHWQVLVGANLPHQFAGVFVQSVDARDVAEPALDDGLVHETAQLMRQVANPSRDRQAALE